MPDLSGVVTTGREAAEARMRDTWSIGTDGGWTYNPATGVDERTILSPITVKGRLKVSGNVAREAEAGERTVVETRRELHIPVASPNVPVNAIARCTAIDDLSDPTMLGITVRLAGPAPGSQTTARRLEVAEVLT